MKIHRDWLSVPMVPLSQLQAVTDRDPRVQKNVARFLAETKDMANDQMLIAAQHIFAAAIYLSCPEGEDMPRWIIKSLDSLPDTIWQWLRAEQGTAP